MSTDIKFGEAQITKIIQSGESFSSWLADLRKKALTNVAFPLAGDKEKNLLYSFRIKIWMKLLEDSGVLIDGVTETAKHEIKNKKVDFLEFCLHL